MAVLAHLEIVTILRQMAQKAERKKSSGMANASSVLAK
jgi:hypothetical protein